jgi:hypothetical protein
MILGARCADCNKLYRVDDKHLGRTLRCRACGGAVPVRETSLVIEAAQPVPSGVATAATVASTPRRSAARQVTDANSFGADDISMGPPPLPRQYASPGPRAAASAPRAAPPDAYLHYSGEHAVDRYLPMLTLIASVWAVLAPIGISAYLFYYGPYAGQVPGEKLRAMLGQYATMLATNLFPGIGVVIGLLMLGMFVASRLAKFPLPDRFFTRSATAVAAPVAFRAGVIWTRLSDTPMRDLFDLSGAWWVASAAVSLAVFALMFRLRPPKLAAALASVGVTCFGLPLAVRIAVLIAWGVGGAQGRWAHTGRQPTPVSAGPQVTTMPPPTAQPLVPRHAPAEPPTPKPSVSNTATPQPSARPAPAVEAPAPVRSTPASAERPAAPAPAPAPTAPGELRGPFTAVLVEPGTSSPAVPDRATTEAAFVQLGVAAREYASRHEGQYASGLKDLSEAGLIDEVDLRRRVGRPLAYLGFHRKAPLPPDYLLAYDADASDGKRTVLFGDGRVRTVPIAEFGKLIIQSGRSVSR